MNDMDFERIQYFPICNPQEIERILNIQDAQDYLLKLRADTIVDHMRLFRVYRNKAIANEKNWSLEKSFSKSHYNSFLRYLTKDTRSKCLETTYGNMFSNDPNGSIFQSDYGPIITISDSLQFFLKFMNLALAKFKSDVPNHVRVNSLRIAIRVMLRTEALDFLMDPRGKVPKDVMQKIHDPIPRQLEYIAGHEFAHYILGHISDSYIRDKPIYFALTTNDVDYKPMKVFNQSQQDEFAADIQSILLPKRSLNKVKGMFETALFWFACLELFEATLDIMHPQSPWGYRSHPSARERIDNLLTNTPTPPNFQLDEWEQFFKNIDKMKLSLKEDLLRNTDFYEMYGSAYLDAPDTEWRGPKLIDRVDYY
ncbi:hypothetical protein ES704_02734 [subsurface metagenome]|jgi:hypothetical protein